MALKISENKKKEVVITVSGPITQEMIQHIADYLHYKKLTQGMKKVSQAQVDELATEIKRAMGRKRRASLAS